MHVILLGPPGAGTGTQGTILAQRLGVPKITTGDLLRDAIQKDNLLGRDAKRFMDRGELVPDKIILSLIKQQLVSPEAAKGIVMDSFPRTVRQAEAVNVMLMEQGERLKRVLLLDVPEEELVRRLLSRSAAEGRGDDTSELIQRRLHAYRESTAPLVGYYREMGILTIVSGTGTEEEITKRIEEVLGT
ncbi:MAG: adenylate kinase [Gemmatimonadota bacterium]|nr:MAG: adenylate kinase [Gemmatimonadota bacterium]